MKRRWLVRMDLNPEACTRRSGNGRLLLRSSGGLNSLAWVRAGVARQVAGLWDFQVTLQCA